jgi:phosphoglycolate phosphatase-like HAD superfamily hydrolase
MLDPALTLKELQPTKKFFVGIDSDGCIFDTMEIKHKECFCPQYVQYFGLQAASKYARETWEFVNLYSKTRGINRFPALVRAIDLLAERDSVKARHIDVPKLQGLRDWIARETKLGNATLAAEVARTGDADLTLVNEWSIRVNEIVKEMVHSIPPFPYVRESLEKLSSHADMVVVSQTPTEALQREWEEHNIDTYVRAIAGQEMGTKTQHIEYAATGKYDADKILMIGDAPGDMKAAKANHALFFPINPGHEEGSWELFFNEGIDRFLNGTFAGEFENALIARFNEALPESAPWQQM